MPVQIQCAYIVLTHFYFNLAQPRFGKRIKLRKRPHQIVLWEKLFRIFFSVDCCGTIQVIMNGVTNSYVALMCVRKQTEQTRRVRTNQHSLIALPLCSPGLLPESVRWNKKLFVQLLLVMESFHSSRYFLVLCHIVDALFLY